MLLCKLKPLLYDFNVALTAYKNATRDGMIIITGHVPNVLRYQAHVQVRAPKLCCVCKSVREYRVAENRSRTLVLP